jgi:HisJ family histidinol phosphate phosphatase
LNDNVERDLRLFAIPDTHGHAKGEHKPYVEERPLPLSARMLFLWFYHACRRGYPRFLMVADHMNYLTFEDPAAVNLVRRALKLAQAGDLYGAAETASVDVAHAAVVSEGLRRGMRFSIGAEVDNDPRSRPDAQNIVDAMRPDGIIRSVHFIPIAHPVHGENWAWPFDNPEFSEFYDTVSVDATWETYVTMLVDAIERLPGHIVGHFYVPALFGHWPEEAKLEGYEDRVLAAAAARGMAVEFNTRFLYRENEDDQKARYLAANKRFLRKARDRGVQIAIGSDAHSPKDQGGAFEIVLEILDELEINEIVFPMGGQLRRVALRVVREPEPEPVPEPTPEPELVAVAEEPPAPVKPVRKARPPARATRAPETSPERSAARSENGATTGQPPASAPPETPAPPKARKDGPKVKPTTPPAAAKPPTPAKPPPVPQPVKPVAKSAPAKAAPAKPAPAKAAPAKAAPAKIKATAKPGTKPAAKSGAKHGPAKAASAPRKSGTAKKAAGKAGTAKAGSAKNAVKKASPARPAPKKAAQQRAATAKKAPKKAPSRAAAKKVVSKKAAAKKAPARAPARKTAAAKKTSTKKTATKRR